jgi:hypothetical protein
MDAYVFLPKASTATQEVLVQLHDEDPETIRAVVLLSGPLDALVAVFAPNLNAIRQIVVQRIRDQAGAEKTETAVVLVEPTGLTVRGLTPRIPRRGLVAEEEVYTRIRTKAGKAQGVLNTLVGLEGFLGGAIVAADFDILLSVGGDTFDQLADRLLQMNSVDGILWSDSAFATYLAAPEESDSQASA